MSMKNTAWVRIFWCIWPV